MLLTTFTKGFIIEVFRVLNTPLLIDKKKITDQTDLSKLYPTIHLTFTKRYISGTLEFQIEGEGGINGETGIFRPRQ